MDSGMMSRDWEWILIGVLACAGVAGILVSVVMIAVRVFTHVRFGMSSVCRPHVHGDVRVWIPRVCV
jgi:hypothetical protein